MGYSGLHAPPRFRWRLSGLRGWLGSGSKGEEMELYRRSFSKRIETGSQAVLRVENRNGRISVRTHGEPVVVIDVQAEVYAESGGEADAMVRRIEEAITADGNSVTVLTPELPRPEWFFFGRGSKVDYEVRVPAGTEVRAGNRNGHVEVRGVQGPVHVDERNGNVVVEDVAGDVEVEDRNGRIRVVRAGGSVRVGVRNGPVSIERAGGAVDVDTTNGPVEIIAAGAGVRIASVNGGVRVSGAVRGDVEISTVNGGVRMAVPRGSRFEIDAESRHGGVHSDLPVRDQAPPPDAGRPPVVKIRTTHGGIRITELEP
jgi:DUF4097 and DUF4098 domain-containing protein YvlB